MSHCLNLVSGNGTTSLSICGITGLAATRKEKELPEVFSIHTVKLFKQIHSGLKGSRLVYFVCLSVMLLRLQIQPTD